MSLFSQRKYFAATVLQLLIPLLQNCIKERETPKIQYATPFTNHHIGVVGIVCAALYNSVDKWVRSFHTLYCTKF